MLLSFTKVTDDYQVSMHPHNLRSKYVDSIMKSLGLGTYDQYIFSFGRFCDYDTNIHGAAIKYLFENLDNPIERHVIGGTETEDYTKYYFTDKTHALNHLNKEQMLFLCGVCHNLNLKPELDALINILISDFDISFEKIRQYVKGSQFNMKIMAKCC